LTAAAYPSELLDRWFPVARGEEIVPRHVVQAQLLDQEIALWRDDAGSVNAWENRCPHRGVRLSIGLNCGTELRCQYHGWRYATGSGQCTYIPAHPGQKPSAAMRVGRFGVTEVHGFVWVSLGTPSGPPLGFAPSAGDATTLRSIYAEASASVIAASLLRGYCFALDPASGEDASTAAAVVATDAYTLSASMRAGERAATVTFLLQPLSASQTVVHGLLMTRGVAADRLTVLRHHNARMSALRDAVETPMIGERQ
jgi:nitrite reductase/ring-hydroxylating ferredoxin subunit